MAHIGFIVFLLHFKIRLMIMSTKRQVFVWKKWDEEMLLTEVSTVEPYKFKVGSKGHGKAWREVSGNLNVLKDLGFKTTHRCVCNKFEDAKGF